MASSPDFTILFFGRVVTGVGVGACFHIAPLYLAEIAPKRIRGALMSFFDLFINIGILAGYIIGWALSPAAGGTAAGDRAWRTMLGLGAVPPALILLALAWLPESPRFLVATGRENDASTVLHSIYSADEAGATLSTLQAERHDSKPLTLCAGLRRVFLPARGAPRMAIIGGIGVAFCQQATGVEAAVYYTPETLEAAVPQC